MTDALASRINPILRLPDVRRVTGLSTTTIYRLMEHGKFPRQRRLGLSSVGWLEREISTWIASRPQVHT